MTCLMQNKDHESIQNKHHFMGGGGFYNPN
jgi:hypothetical protein